MNKSRLEFHQAISMCHVRARTHVFLCVLEPMSSAGTVSDSSSLRLPPTRVLSSSSVSDAVNLDRRSATRALRQAPRPPPARASARFAGGCLTFSKVRSPRIGRRCCPRQPSSPFSASRWEWKPRPRFEGDVSRDAAAPESRLGLKPTGRPIFSAT